MALQKIPQLGWNTGEIARNRQGRVDIAKYAGGCSYMVNFIPMEGGEFEARPGTQFIADVKDHANPPRTLPFVYNDVQSYIVELGAEYARFFMLGGQLVVEDGDDQVPYEIVSPYALGDLDWLQFAQRNDVMLIAGGARGYRAQTLTRTKHTDWAFADWQSDTGPFLDPNATAITLTPSAVSGSVTLTASASLFADGHVGALFRIEEDDTNGYSMWEPAKSYAAGAVVRFGNNVYEATHTGSKTSGAVAPVHTFGKRHDGVSGTACEWLYLHSGYGVCRITAVGGATSATATVLSRLPSTSAVKRWREGAFSDYRGHPVAVALAGQRLWWLGTKTMPRTGWGSVAGAPFDFTPGPNADDAVTFTLESTESNPIRAAAERGRLYVFTSKRAYQVTGTNGGPIKPDDIVAVAVSGSGSNGCQPTNVGRAVLYPDQSGRRLQELSYSEAADDDASRDLTKLAVHIMQPGQ